MLDIFENSHFAETRALLDNPTLTADDRQTLETIIQTWPVLSPEVKISILQIIHANFGY